MHRSCESWVYSLSPENGVAQHSTDQVQALFCSPRNNLEGNLKLIDSTKCSILLRGSSKSGFDLLENRPLKALDIMTLEQCIREGDARACPFEETWATAQDKSLVILHTSGSTGLPKPVVVSHGLIAVVDAFHDLEPVQGR